MPSPCNRRRFLAGSASAGAALAAGSVPSRAQSTDSDPDPVDHDDLEAFVDDAVESELAETDASGAVVSVVHDGSVALSKGYGETVFDGTDVTATETPVQTGSISKLVTFTAAMQLVERGEIDPRSDVTDSLESVSIPDAYDDPITLAHLATHTPGFEIRSRNDTVGDLAHRQPLAKSISSYRPARIRPPGELMGYTNYAAAVTGQLVADVDGSSFQEYARREIFAPLEMDRSTFAPVPDHLEGDDRDALVDALPWHSNVPPASGLWSTGTDMAQFMLAHLGAGRTDAGRILSRGATEMMHSQWFSPHEELDGMAFGFFERIRDDVRILYHGGSGPSYGSQLVLVPELDLGLFVSFQGSQTGAAAGSFEDAFLDRYVPTTDAALTPAGRPERADEIEGSYRPFPVHEHTTYGKLLLSTYTADVEVRIEDDGTLVTDTGSTSRWVEVEPLVFRRVDGQRTLVFHEDGDDIAALSSDGMPWAAVPITRLDDLSVQAGLALGASLVALSGSLGWPLAAAVRRYRGSPQSRSGPPRRARLAAGGAGGLLFGFVAAVVVAFALVSTLDAPSLLQRPPRGFGLLFVLPIAGAAATLVAVGYVVQAWLEGFWSRPVRVHYTAVVCALAVLLWLFRYWNLFWP
ncbi:serine hydrolase domain-containing protein [Natrinema salsiterrestre]|uniref:Beta-lactamase family protein n=1 Tax=Natrinema salsiterrestre TaxID=2950540 RepID=A0A9Q4L472_9EURY|nr:serine hydrolase domain-containing protein [Natrinema salsiterrestre]MDF9746548.1 beta-lactamase family protein [Natrinema salsiterrestre]